MRKEKDMETGKHFKEEERLSEMMEPETLELSADVMPDAWYKARIKQLEGEYMRLNQEIQALEDKEDKLNGVINELHEAIAELEVENTKLRDEIIRRIVA